MAIYLKLPNISGNVTSKDYSGWIELNDVEFSGVHVPVAMSVGRADDRLNKLPRFGQIKAQSNQQNGFPNV